jgi:hypothetical protein
VLAVRFIAIVAVFLCLIGTGISQESDAQPIPAELAEVFLAKKGVDGQAGERAANFLVTDIPIFCVVRLPSPGVATVRLDFIAAKVPGVKPESKVVSLRYVTKEAEDRVNFSSKPQGLWVPGTYRVDVFVGTRKVSNIEFEIRAVPGEVAKPSTIKPSPTTRKPVKRSTAADALARQTLGKAFW